MKFLIQNDEDTGLEIETLALKLAIKNSNRNHSYVECSLMDKFPEEDFIPFGTIEFVKRYLMQKCGVHNMSPLEVPKILRTDEFLGREYSILSPSEFPTCGYYFVKNASILKQPTYCGNIQKIDESLLCLYDEYKYVVSEQVQILSEFRVFVWGDRIMGIQFYDGYPLALPNPKEVMKIQDMVDAYKKDATRPKAYAMDVAVKNLKRDLVLIEMCPFTSLGTYGLVGDFLPEMYADGFQWYLDSNNPVEV